MKTNNNSRSASNLFTIADQVPQSTKTQPYDEKFSIKRKSRVDYTDAIKPMYKEPADKKMTKK